MALLSTADVKSYLRIEHAEDDTLIGLLIARAKALVEGYLGVPITAASRTFELVAVDRWGVVLYTPLYPVGTPTVFNNGDGVAVTAPEYTQTGQTGRFKATAGYSFLTGPYTVTAPVGLSLASDYSTRIEPALNAAMLDMVADFYQRRNPAAQSEGSGGGIYTQWASTLGMPARCEAALAPFRSVTRAL